MLAPIVLLGIFSLALLIVILSLGNSWQYSPNSPVLSWIRTLGVWCDRMACFFPY
ncbi:hypothetical protein BDW74DRAFT_141382 [Aspergillus multicolor]|uniref:uncharacterized protein n=1 Tax=Aspergillus multicolor TaxID=41759 RepID=UPI003CCCF16D